MARPSSRDFLVLRMQGMGSEGQRMSDLSNEDRKIQREINRAMRDLERDTQGIYRMFAPKGKTRELARKIISRANFRAHSVTVTVSSGARHGGFAYTPVTRVGHASQRIYPKRSRVLVFSPRGTRGTIRRAWVRGYRPKTDWVTDADVLVSGAIDRAEQRIGRNIETVVLRDAR